MPTLLYVIGSAAGIVIAAFIGWTVRTIRKVVSRAARFFDDWDGEPARPGVDARPGVMHRLGALEAIHRDILKRVLRIESEVFPNGGASMRDTIDRIEAGVRRQGNGEQP